MPPWARFRGILVGAFCVSASRGPRVEMACRPSKHMCMPSRHVGCCVAEIYSR